MERRKLIKFGKNSFVISLPKEWVARNGLQKGAELFVEERQSSVVVAAREIIREERLVHINCDKPLEIVENEINCSYRAGFDTLIIEGKTLKQQAAKIKEHILRLAGVEIIDQTLNQMVVKDLIDIKQIALPTLINRLDMMIRSMIQDVLAPEQLPEGAIRERDRELNRLQFLASRVTRNLLENPSLSTMLKVSIVEAYYIDRAAWTLERIGDYVKRIDYDITGCAPRAKKRLKQMLNSVYEKYVETMKAYYNRSTAQALAIHDNVIKLFPELVELVLTVKDPNQLLVLENIRNFVRDLRIVLRITIEMSNPENN